ncbi:MAG: hypothetical protein Kow0089_24830 [Desulfobulbaceae bacterium]
MEERRKHKRYRMLDSACIINHATTVGNILDISDGGFSCMCLDQGDCREGLVTKINIYCNKIDLRAEDIDIEVLSTGTFPGRFLEDLGLRKCRARFGPLDEAQRAMVKQIMEIGPEA